MKSGGEVSLPGLTISCMLGSLRTPILVNRYERSVDTRLSEFGARHGLRLFPKVRVADVLPVSERWLNGAEVSYGLKAHFDFVLADSENNAELVVEFDGPSHWSDPKTMARDQMKDAICRRYALPILRIGAAALDPLDDRRTFLQWILEVWSAYRNLAGMWAEVEAAVSVAKTGWMTYQRSGATTSTTGPTGGSKIGTSPGE
jgi:hypothetical protein